MKKLFEVEWKKQSLIIVALPMIVGPLLISLIVYFLLIYLSKNGQVEQPWMPIYELIKMNWSYIIITIVIIFSAVVVDIEHKFGMWPRLLTFPHQKWKLFLVKLIWIIIPVQAFGIITWFSISTISLFYTEYQLDSFKVLGSLIYVPFIFATPFIIVQTLTSIVIENTFVSIGIGMSIFLFHKVLSFWWLPWGPLLCAVNGDACENISLPVFLLLIISYSIFSLLVFYKKSFSSGVE